MHHLKKFTQVVIILASVGLTPLHADAPKNGASWAVLQAGNCKVILNAGAFYANATLTQTQWADDNLSFSWGGGCDSSGLADGYGILTQTKTNPAPDPSFPDRPYHYIFEGNFTHGLMDGTFQEKSVENSWADVVTFSNGCDLNSQQYGASANVACRAAAGLAQQAKFAPLASASGAFQNENGGTPASRTDAANTATASNGDIFNKCIRLESLGQPGIEMLWQLTNTCNTKVYIAYCFKSEFAALESPNLCRHHINRNTYLSPGENIEFAYGILPDGTAMSDGRLAQDDQLEVVGHGCVNNAPGVRFDGNEFVFAGC